MEMLKVHPQASASSQSTSEFFGRHNEYPMSSMYQSGRSDEFLGHINAHPDEELLARPQPHHHVFRYWKWEGLSLCLATGSLIAVFILITRYDDQATAKWRFLINLTTLQSLLATVFRVFLLVPITSVISQSKWDWVGGDTVRSLKDIQEIDNASRGPWGALRVIPLAAKGNVPMFVAALSSLLMELMI